MGNDEALTRPEVTRILREMAGGLEPGQPLPSMRELRGRLSVTSWVLNQALRDLERDGLVTVVPRKGVYAREGQPEATRYLQVVYVDNPSVQRLWEYCLGPLAFTADRLGLECRTVHLNYRDLERLRETMEASRHDGLCAGVVLSGFITPESASYLKALDRPWVLLGDGHSPTRLERLPIVTGDSFQGAQLAADHLLSEGCDHLVMVNFYREPDWPWIAASRAGVFSVLERNPGAAVYLPRIDCRSHPREFEEGARSWLSERDPGRVGILCRGAYMLHVATPIRSLLTAPEEPALVVTELAVSPPAVPGVDHVFCSLQDLADACLRRLDAMRRGVDSPGRLQLPFKLIPASGGESADVLTETEVSVRSS